MGAWGVAIFSDDLAADIRIEFRELIGDGLTASEATARLQVECASSLDDPDEMPVFWLALALTQWKLGRVEESVRRHAVRIIDDGIDLARWGDAKSRARRAVVLAKARAELMSVPPPATRVPRTVREASDRAVKVVWRRLAVPLPRAQGGEGEGADRASRRLDAAATETIWLHGVGMVDRRSVVRRDLRPALIRRAVA